MMIQEFKIGAFPEPERVVVEQLIINAHIIGDEDVTAEQLRLIAVDILNAVIPTLPAASEIDLDNDDGDGDVVFVPTEDIQT